MSLTRSERIHFLRGSSPDVAEWVRTQLGINPNQCTNVTINLDASEVVTAEVRVFLTADQLAALELTDMSITKTKTIPPSPPSAAPWPNPSAPGEKSTPPRDPGVREGYYGGRTSWPWLWRKR